MPTFRYTAMTSNGRRVAGQLAGATEQAVLAELESRSLLPVRVDETRSRRLLQRKVSARRLGQTYVELSELLGAGVPLLRALRLLGGRKSGGRLASAFKDMGEAVEGGEAMGDAMAKRPDVFTSIHVAMVRAGERGGFLEQVFSRLGQLVLGQAELRGKIVGSLVYPSVLVLFGVIVLSVVFGYFVPKFKPMFARLESLPPVTEVVFAMSDSVTEYGGITAIVLGLLGFGAWRAMKEAKVRRAVAVAKTRGPIVGPIVRNLAVSRFCRMLGTMLGNGVPMIAAMEISKDATGNLLLEEAIVEATDAVRQGEPLAGPLGKSGLIGDDVLEMISVGEQANNLDEVLVRVAETIDKRTDRLFTAAVRLVEPLMLLLIAAIVGIVAISLLLPIMQLSDVR
ncbi:MAG: type II secretion system F family protein [Phycisphaerales bacterium]